MQPGHRLRLTANVLNGSTLAGIVVASAGGAGLRPAGDGLLVGSGYQLPVPRAAAFCLGNVLVTSSTMLPSPAARTCSPMSAASDAVCVLRGPGHAAAVRDRGRGVVGADRRRRLA